MILTAAHCVDCKTRGDPSACYDRVVLGRHSLVSHDEVNFVQKVGAYVGKAGTDNITNTPLSGIGRLKFDRSEIQTHIHPSYERNPHHGAKYDFALLQLPTRIYNETATGASLKSVSLNPDDHLTAHGESLKIVGWGATKTPTRQSSHMSPVLREGTVRPIDNKLCQRVSGYADNTFYSYKGL